MEPTIVDIIPHRRHWVPRVRTMLIAATFAIGPAVLGWTPSGEPAVVRADCGVFPLNTVNIVGEVGDILYVGADDGRHGYELWRTDGTATGTTLVRDMLPGRKGWAYLQAMATIDDSLWFFANSGGNGELWGTDGTRRGTTRVKDFDGSDWYHVEYLAEVAGTVVFLTSDGGFRYALWRSDGTPRGTTLIDDFRIGPDDWEPNNFAIVGSWLSYTLNEAQLWRTDGTAAGTLLLLDAATAGGETYVGPLTSVGDTLYFTVDGQQLWRTDGTATGTVLLLDADATGGSLGTVTPLGDTLSVWASGRLWRTDGTPEGTTPVTGVADDVWAHALVGRMMVFLSDGQVWRSDGTAEGTTLVTDLGTAGGLRSLVYLAVVGDALDVIAAVGDESYELWRTDGTAEGSTLVSDALPRPEGSRLGPFAITGEALYFIADDGLHGRELWRSDGTAEGTTLVKDVRPGPEGSRIYAYPVGLIVVGEALYFIADDGLHGRELWRSDGTAEGTSLVKDVRRGRKSSVRRLTAVAQQLYFTIPDRPCVAATELWRTDGTPEGTVRLLSVRP